MERHRAVEEPAVDDEGQTDRDGQVPARRCLRQARQRIEHAAQQRVLEEEVAAGVGRQPELRTDGVVRTARVDVGQQPEMRVDVEDGIGDPHLGHAHGHAREAVRADVEEVAHEAIIIARPSGSGHPARQGSAETRP